MDVQELRRLHGAATQGEWTVHTDSCGVEYVLAFDPNDEAHWLVVEMPAGERQNAPAIAALHNAAPALFDAANRLARVEAVLASDEAVERVARVLWHEEWLGNPGDKWEDVRSYWHSNARAAIAALRELIGETK